MPAHEEDYEERINEKLPDYLHRGDIVPTSRLQGYLDAMFATCATFLVLPLRNLHHMKPDESLESFLDHKWPEFIVFFLGFLVICTLWESHVVRFSVIKRLDDLLVFMVVISLLVVTMLPFWLALEGHYIEERIAVVFVCVSLFIVEMAEIAMIFYAFASPRLLHIDLHECSADELRRIRNIICLKNVITAAVIIIAGLLTLAHYYLAWFVIALVILLPIARQGLWYWFRHRETKEFNKRVEFFHEFSKGRISKERIEVMSDAAVAIIACVLILDLTVEEFPKKEDVAANGLVKVLHHMWKDIFIYIGCYFTVSMLWFINHSVLHFFHTVDMIALYLQKIFLAFMSLTPLAANMMLKFMEKRNEDEQYGTRIGYIFILCSSFANLLLLLWGYHKKEKCLHTWASLGQCWLLNTKQHWYILLKNINIPFWSIIILFGTLGDNYLATNIVRYVCFSGMILSFFVLKLTLQCHWGKSTVPPTFPTSTFITDLSTTDTVIENMNSVTLNDVKGAVDHKKH